MHFLLEIEENAVSLERINEFTEKPTEVGILIYYILKVTYH